MKLSNVKEIKTTIMAIVGGVLMLLGIFYPETIDENTGDIIRSSANEILTGLGGLITVLTGIFAKD